MRGELEIEQTPTNWPQVPLSLAALLSHSTGCSTGGPEGPALCWELVPAASNCNCNWLQLTRTLYGTGLYNCLSLTCFLWASHLHRIQPVHGQGYILISSTGCTCFSIEPWSKVNMLQLEDWSSETQSHELFDLKYLLVFCCFFFWGGYFNNTLKSSCALVN